MSDEIVIPPADPLVGATVGEYQLIEPIGEGGMGVVYRGIQPVIKKRVAVKVLKPHVANDEHQVRRLVMEAEAVNAIGHRGIIDIFGLGQLPDGRPYVVMEYLEGEPLDVWLHRQPGGRVPLTTALELLLEVCAPLAAAHRANVIHRDLKPSNVFVCFQADGSRFLKLLDFGLAKRALGLDGNTKQTSQATVSGTPDYMAPEQARGLSVSPRSDLYALGVMAFELFTGQVPFVGSTPMDVMVAHVGTKPRPPRSLEPSLPEELNQLVLKLLAKSPDARPQSADEVRTALEDILVSLGNPRPRSSRNLPSAPSGSTPAAGVMAAEPAETEVSVAPVVPSASNRRTVIIGLVSVLVGAAVTWSVVRFTATREAKNTGATGVVSVKPPDERVAVLPPVVVDAGPAAPEVVDAGLAMAVDAGVEPVAVVGPKVVVRKVSPKSFKEKSKDVADLLSKCERQLKAKQDRDPTAELYLNRYRLDAAKASKVDQLDKVESALRVWQKRFL